MNLRSSVVAAIAGLAVVTSCSALIGFDQPAERGAQCSDGVDNDGNGIRDCEEASCADVCSAACGEGIAADGRAVDPATGYCYLSFATGQGVFAANEECMTLGGHLAVPDDAAEDALIRSIAAPDAALGIADVDYEAGYDFRLVTGDRPAQYTNFTAGQPDGPAGTVLCVSYDGVATTWKDDSCETPRPYVCEITPEPCGDFVRQPGEECDDGNAVAGDGCAAACVDEDECVMGTDNCDPNADCMNQTWNQNSPGFSCQCRAGFAGDGVTCTALPPAPNFVVRNPAAIPGLLGCNSGTPRRGHKIAIDPFGALYVVQLCPETNNAVVTVSVDAGATWSTPQEIGADVVEAAVVGIAPGRAAVALVHRTSTEVTVRLTVDFGATWEPERSVFATVDTVPGISIATDGFDVLIGLHPTSGGYRVQRSTGPDLIAFTGADTSSVAFGDVLVDPQNPSHVYAVGDTGTLHVSESSDGGRTFGADVMPDGTQPRSDWGIGGGFIYAAGERDDVSRMAVSSLGTIDVAGGLGFSLDGERSVVVGNDGTAYVAYTGEGGVEVARWTPVSTVFEAAVSIDPMGDTPSIEVVPGALIAAVYRSLGDVHFAIIVPILPQ
jgi:cysteine-rich repeat protein